MPNAHNRFEREIHRVVIEVHYFGFIFFILFFQVNSIHVGREHTRNNNLSKIGDAILFA